MKELRIMFDQRGDIELLSGRFAHVYLDGKKLEKCTGVSFELTVKVLAKDIAFEGPCNVVIDCASEETRLAEERKAAMVPGVGT